MLEIRITSFDAPRWRRAGLLFLGLLLALWAAWVVREIWLPLLVAFLIAMVLDPLVDRMERRGWSRTKGAVVIYAAFFVVMGLLLGLALPAILSQTSTVVGEFGKYLPQGDESETRRALQRLLVRLNATPFVESTVLQSSEQISAAFQNLQTYVGKMAQGVVVNILWMVVIPVVSFYLLRDFHVLYARLLLFVPRDQRPAVQDMVNQITAVFVKYLRGLALSCGLFALVTALVLWLFRVPNAFALGAISGLLYLVPYVGAALTVVLTGGVALMALPVGQALLVIVTLFLIHNVIFDYVITPRIVGEGVGLHPILSIVALLSGGALLGLLGMILAVPFAATIRLVALALFPKLAQPIEVPEGIELHAQAGQRGSDEVQEAVDVHEAVAEAVAESEREEGERGDFERASAG